MGKHADRAITTGQPKAVVDSRAQQPAGETGVSAFSPASANHQSLKELAGQSEGVKQLKAYQNMADQAVVQRQANNTGMPDNLKTGIESLSGYSMSDVKVHYNSDKPAQLNAHAYAQGNQIHLASGQEKHLPHEAWHVVQQKQGRVKPTRQLKGKVAVNDDAGLEKEADEMGAKALQMKAKEFDVPNELINPVDSGNNGPVQRYMVNAGPIYQGGVPPANFNTADAASVIAFRTWVEAAAQTNVPALRSVAEQFLLNADAIDRDDPALVEYVLTRADRAIAEIQVEGAQMIYSDNDFTGLRAQDTVVMRAINTGDMYHIKAVLAIDPRFRLLIWGVNPTSRSQARMVASLVNDPNIVYATDKSEPPAGFNQTETWATAEIERYLTSSIFNNIPAVLADNGMKVRLKAIMDANTLGLGPYDLNAMNEQRFRAAIGALRGRKAQDGNNSFDKVEAFFKSSRQTTLARNFAPYTDEEGLAFRDDLLNRGHFDPDGRYILVNFRATGHSNRPGANAPALDTGTTGVRQIIGIIQGYFGGNVIPVPMGEEPANMNNGPNLLSYWTWPSMQGSRLKQASILRYLNENFNIIGAVGMRSGVIDQMVFAGIKVLSLDIGPNKGMADGELPDLATSKGWDRGLKLENAYQERYGRAFIDHGRRDEQTRNVPGWTGRFHDDDVRVIIEAVSFYFNNRATATNYRDASHPFNAGRVDGAFLQLKNLVAGRDVTAYDLINHIGPYLRHMMMHINSMDSRRAAITNANEALEAKVTQLQLGKLKPILWMRQNTRHALIDEDFGNQYYADQLAWVHRELNRADPATSLQAYRTLHADYSAPFRFNELWAAL